MENAIEFLIDSNWVVTLSSILVTIYVFVLSVPALLQQTLLPEKLREVANHHNYFDKEVAKLKEIGGYLLLFLFLYGNPFWKYFFFTYLPANTIVGYLIFIHSLGFFFFCFNVFIMYSFIQEYILFKKKKGIEVNPFFRLKQGVQTTTTTYYASILERVKGNILKDVYLPQSRTGNIQLSFIDDLVKLAYIAEDNLYREKFLNTVKDIVYEVCNNDMYKGDLLRPIIHDVLIEDLNRNFQVTSISNINKILEVSKLIISRYVQQAEYEKELNDFDINELRKLLITLANYLVNNISINGNDRLFVECFKYLKSIPASYFDCFLIQKKIKEGGQFKFVNLEITEIKNTCEHLKKENFGDLYYVAYLSWLYNEESIILKTNAKKEFRQFIMRCTPLSEFIKRARIFFGARGEYFTVDSIIRMIKIEYLK